jgi:CheY-like chemotaxis protein/HPt (histidine-containing phosphotransfer) domain-containing protein
LQTKSLKSLNVLVAEDDKVNQALVKSLLKKMGCSYTIVETGVKALECLKNSSFDLILMDVEMPEMDGYQTTIKIRQDFSPPLSNIPIISTTAHVKENDIKKCMDVGMNDYVVKPIKLPELLKKIKSLIKDIDITEFQLEETPNQTSAENVFKFSNLSAACGNNPAIAKNIIKLFLSQSPENMRQLGEFLGAADWDNYKNLCHKMKAAYALLGFPDVKKHLEEMEHDCSQNNINVAKFESYVTLIRNTNTTIKQVLEETLEKEK